jgi:xanthine dehydrogenase accessory factor
MELWCFIQQKLEQGIDIVLLVVIVHQGSSPGRTGFKMVVAADGELSGTIGGGQAEYSLVEEAKQLLAGADNGIYLHRLQHDQAGSGMICSGSQSVALYPLGSGFLPTLEQIISAGTQGEQNLILYRESGIQLCSLQSAEQGFCQDGCWCLTEQCSRSILHIFGCGHVSQALSRIFSLLDFTVHIYDDRPDTVCQEDTPPGQRRILVNYDRVEQLVVDNMRNYVVIMTFAHGSDERVLRQMAAKPCCYLGMMGSGQKVRTVFRNLLRQGISQEQLDRVHAPVGLDINSRTAAEIAVSIAAEIIGEKNKDDIGLPGLYPFC